MPSFQIINHSAEKITVCEVETAGARMIQLVIGEAAQGETVLPIRNCVVSMDAPTLADTVVRIVEDDINRGGRLRDVLRNGPPRVG